MVELTRRDALGALATVGAASAAGCVSVPEGDAPDDRSREVLVAAAEVLYPTAVTGHREFVETYVAGRVADRETYRRGIRETTADLDDVARAWYDRSFASLAPDRRDAVLGEVGADTADPAPEGSLAGRVRYYVVEELLYALFASPPGGRLAGIENPVGFPGGIRSYQRGPES